MQTYSFCQRRTRDILAIVEAPTYGRALEFTVRAGLCLVDVELGGAMLRSAFLARADLRGAGLRSADLSGCYLRGADLRSADLRGTRLTRAFLGGADLRQADLRGAVLSRADLRGARLVEADLRGTILTGARLTGALCDWRWSAIPAELLRRQPDSSGGDTRLVMEMAFHDDSQPWSWLKLLTGCGKQADWAFRVLADSIRDGDNAPDLLRCLTSDAAKRKEGSLAAPAAAFSTQSSVGPDRVGNEALDPHLEALASISASPPMLWIRRHLPTGDAARTMQAS